MNDAWRPTAAYSPRSVLVLLLSYSICLLAGTYTHAKDLIGHGFLAAPVPVAIGLYWNSLTLLDPLAVLLLWWRPKLGIILTAAIMASDLAINTAVYLVGYSGPPIPHLVPLSLFEQSLFGVFVFVTGPLAYQLLSHPKRPLESS
jgi:hypothetical protein